MRCEVCDIKVTGERNYKEHIKGKRHQFRLQLLGDKHKKHPCQLSPPLTIDGSPTLTSEGPAPPGYEEFANRISQIQPELDALKSTPLIGLEYLIEASGDDDSYKLQYYCLLCDKMGAKAIVIKHIVSYNHQLNYLKRFFPSVYGYIQKIREDPESKGLSSTIMNGIAKKIEAQFGRLKPLAVEKRHFVGRKRYYFEKISRAHLRETPGINLKEVMDVNLLPAKKQVKKPVDDTLDIEKLVIDTKEGKHISSTKHLEKPVVYCPIRKRLEKETTDPMGFRCSDKQAIDTVRRKCIEKSAVDFPNSKRVEKLVVDLSGSKCIETPEFEILDSKCVKETVVVAMGAKSIEQPSTEILASKHVEKAADITLGAKCIKKSPAGTLAFKRIEKTSAEILASKRVEKTVIVTLGSKSVEKPKADTLGSKSLENRTVDTIGSKDVRKSVVNSLDGNLIQKPLVESLVSKHLEKPVVDTPDNKDRKSVLDIPGYKCIKKLDVETSGSKYGKKPVTVTLKSKDVGKPMVDIPVTKHVEKPSGDILASKHEEKPVIVTLGCKRVEKPMTDTRGIISAENLTVDIKGSKDVGKAMVDKPGTKDVEKPSADTLASKQVMKPPVVTLAAKHVKKPPVVTLGTKCVEKPSTETLASERIQKPGVLTLGSKFIEKPTVYTLGTKSLEKRILDTISNKDAMKPIVDTIGSKHLVKPVVYTLDTERAESPEIEILGSKYVKKLAVGMLSSRSGGKPVVDLTVLPGNKLAGKQIETYDLTDESTRGAAQQISLFHKSRFSMDQTNLRKTLKSCDDSSDNKSVSEKEPHEEGFRTRRRYKEEDDCRTSPKRRKLSPKCRIHEHGKYHDEENRKEKTILNRLTSVSPVSSRSWSRSLSRSPDYSTKRSKPLYKRSRSHSKSKNFLTRSPGKSYGRTSFRSRSPVGRSSMDSRSRGGDRYNPYKKRNYHERDQKTDWDIFREEASIIDTEMEKASRYYVEFPDRHPTYASQWKKFCTFKVDNRKSDRGMHQRSCEFKQEWISYWKDWLKKLYGVEAQNKKSTIRKKLGLPENRTQNIDAQKYEKLTFKATKAQTDVPSHGGKREENAVTVTDMKMDWKLCTSGDMVNYPEKKEKHMVQSTSKGEIRKEQGNHPGLIATLRLITALEDQLGSLGPKVNYLLSQALALQRRGSVVNMLLQNSENLVLFETVKEKFLGHLQAGIVRKNIVDAVKQAIETISNLLQEFSFPKKQKVSDGVCLLPKYQLIPISPTPARNTDFMKMIKRPTPVQFVGSGGELDQVAKRIAQALVEEGRTDLSEQDLRSLVSQVVNMSQGNAEGDKCQTGMSSEMSQLNNPGVGTTVSKGSSPGEQSFYCSHVAPDPRFELAHARMARNTSFLQYVDQMRQIYYPARPPIIDQPAPPSKYISWQAPFASSHFNSDTVIPLVSDRSRGNLQFAGLYCDNQSVRQDSADSLQNSHESGPAGANADYIKPIHTIYSGLPS